MSRKKERYITLHVLTFNLIFHIEYYAGNKRKCKEEDLPSVVVTLLAKLDEQADKRMEEREEDDDATGRARGETTGAREKTRAENENNNVKLYAADYAFPPANPGYNNSSPSFTPPSFQPAVLSTRTTTLFVMILTMCEHYYSWKGWVALICMV